MSAKIISINISSDKGLKKKPVESAIFIKDKGIQFDAHSGTQRQVSLLAIESIRKMSPNFKSGDFAENLTTEGLNLLSLPVRSTIKIGEVILEITEHGKVCHDRCEIFKTHGRCVMPEEGIFAKVIKGGLIRQGDFINR